jgi:hypothetical protein
MRKALDVAEEIVKLLENSGLDYYYRRAALETAASLEKAKESQPVRC